MFQQSISAQALRDRSSMLIGKVETGGTVRDRNNMTIGHVESDGSIRDRNNMVVGYAKGISKTYAAVFFFFDLFRR